MKFQYKIIDVEDLSIDKIKELLDKYPNEKILLNIPNTKNITIESLNLLPKSDRLFIRIEGGFDKKRIADYQDKPSLIVHVFSNIYTVDEVKEIIKELEKIEKGMFSSWSEEQKLLYFISVIQDSIIYHPDFESIPTQEIRSLRGLLSKKTVCAGYSLILKELCDRNNIECDYVEGACNKKDLANEFLTHAWNIVKIKGYYFPIDLTWNADDFRYGEMKTVDSLCNAQEFIQSHFPGKHEKIQDYPNTLRSMDSNFIRQVFKSLNISKDLYSTRFSGTRKDGSKFTITQVGNDIINDEMVYKYIYIDENNIPLILYSSFNVAEFVLNLEEKNRIIKALKEAKRLVNLEEIQECEKKLKNLSYIDERLNYYIKEVLFSTENIKHALKKRNFYLGNIYNYKVNPQVLINLHIASKLESKVHFYKRSDGTIFVLEENNKINSNGHDLYFYQMFEYVFENNEIHLKTNNIYTDFSLFDDQRKEIADIFLSRKRVDLLAYTNGGYLGNYTKDGKLSINEKLLSSFDRKERKELKRSQIKDKVFMFEDLKTLLIFYDLKVEDNSIAIYDKRTKAKILNSTIRQRVIFASIWLESVRMYDSNANIDSAFSDKYYKIYKSFVKLVSKSILTYQEIRTLEIYEQLVDKFGEEIKDMIAYLFKNNLYLNVIYNIFNTQDSCQQILIPLFNSQVADKMLEARKSLENGEYQMVGIKK